MQAAPTTSPGNNQSANPDATQSERLFQCSHCKKSFTRADHLTRHVRAHTKSKPFVCPICSKAFARTDLLKRHVTNHELDSSNKRQRREITRDTRAIQACEACSQSHLRCEDEKPCSRCKKRNIPCRVPENSAAGDDIDNDDTVHAAQDLLGLSGGFDQPLSLSPAEESVNMSSASQFNNHLGLHAFDHSTSMQTKNVPNNMTSAPVSERRPRVQPTETLNSVQGHLKNAEAGLIPSNQPYSENTTSSMPYFGGNMPAEYFQNIPQAPTFIFDHNAPRGIMDLSFNFDVGLTDLDVGLLDQYNFQVPFVADTPSTDSIEVEQQFPESESAPFRAKAFKQSIWRWTPHPDQNYLRVEQAHLAGFSDTEKESHRRSLLTQRRAIVEKLSLAGRDQLMALVLGTSSPENIKRIASAFPSIELLDGLIQYFLTSPSLDAQSWLHIPTFSPSKISPELLAVVVAAGAASTPDTALRKLGFAMQEASRLGQARVFEENNASVRDVKSLQTLFLGLNVGMWSGVSRKMEMAEGFLPVLGTMLRRGSWFRRSTWKEIMPSTDDQGPALESKWLQWIRQESLLRLIYRAFALDRQSSMALLKPPIFSYAEMHLPLPSSNVLWQAKTAVAWRSAYLEIAPITMRRPSAIECFRDLEHLAQHDHTCVTYLYMMWGMVWEYCQMNTLTVKTNSRTNHSLILSSRHQELTKELEDFRVSSPPLSKSVEIILEIMLMHLNAPLEDIQLFAGIEGQEEAQAAYPILREWTKSVSARQALWHAGQILRAAEGLPKTLICNFNAVAIYHAGLILWGYMVLKRSGPAIEVTPAEQVQTAVILNGNDSLGAQRFVTLNRGLPSIRSSGSQGTVSLSNISKVMDALILMLQAPHGAIDVCPPMVGNLIQLLEGLRSSIK